MVIAVRTERGPDGIEVVKEADTAEGRGRLAAEAAILRRAAHPGVVEVIESSDSVLRLRHSGSPLARLGAVAPDHAAAIVRAVSEIVDALHRQGIVHRRIDADHVVVNERGRPHLIGFGAAGDGDAAGIADDVAALGALLERLLDEGNGVLWSPSHRGVRAATRRKRAMAAFRAATASAQRPDAGQRPSAHQFATAIGEALPGLTLPTPPGAPSDDAGPDGFAEIPHDMDPTSDLGWTDFDLSFLAVDEQVAPDTEIERNPAAPRDPYAVLESLASPDPDAVALQSPVLETPESETPQPETLDVGSEPDDVAVTDPADEDTDPIIAALRAAMAAEPTPEPEFVDPFADLDRQDLQEDESPADLPARETAASTDDPSTDVPDSMPVDEAEDFDDVEEAEDVDLRDDQTLEVEPDSAPIAEPAAAFTPSGPQPPSIQIRPGDADPTPADRSGPSRRMLITIAVVVLLAGAVAGSVIARAVDPFGADSAAAAPEQTADTSTTTTSEATDPLERTPPPPPEGCDAVTLPGPDADGDGCPDEVTVSDRVATVGAVAVELGQQGDLVVVADSDCDGIATPVVLRPDTGEVFVFPEWNLDAPVEVEADQVVAEAIAIVEGPGECPDVIVTDAAGAETIVAPR